MNKIAITLAAILALGTNMALADVSADEAVKLRESGTIKDVKELNDIAVQQYPGTKIESTELDLENGVYEYEVDLVDEKGTEYTVHLNAASGEVIKKEID